MTTYKTPHGNTVIPVQHMGGGVWLVEAVTKNGKIVTTMLASDIPGFKPPCPAST